MLYLIVKGLAMKWCGAKNICDDVDDIVLQNYVICDLFDLSDMNFVHW